MYQQKLDRLRALLARHDAAGAVFSTVDNVYWLSGYRSVMDGWLLPEPMSAVFVPADPAQPVVLVLPEASLIAIVVSDRAGHRVRYDRLATFDLLNFCEMARAHDASAKLDSDIAAELATVASRVIGDCQPSIVESLAAISAGHAQDGRALLFDDMRIALAVNARNGARYGDAYDLAFAARAIKTAAELDVFRESGRKADRVMSHTVAQLGVGKRWSEIEKSVAHFMIDEDIDPLPSSPMLFGGAYDMVFRPELFRTPYDQPFEPGQIAILETQGKYRHVWIDINRTAHIGQASAEYREQHALVQRCFEQTAARLLPGSNSAAICEDVRSSIARELDAPEKLQLIVHAIGLVPLESPSGFPTMGLRASRNGFEIQQNMVLSFDCLYFGSRLGPSHMENVFVIGPGAPQSLYAYPLELIEA